MRGITFDGDMRKHLLFSAVTASAVNLIKRAFIISEDDAIFFVLALIAAINVTLAYVNLIYFLPNVFSAFWFSALYGMMFTNLVLFSIPETYSLSGLFILFYFLCFFNINHLSPLYLSLALGVIAGIASLFNPPLLSLVVMQVVLIIRKHANEINALRACFLGVGIAGIIYVFPNLFIHGNSYFDVAIRYLNKFASFENFLNLEKVGTVIVGFLFYSFLSPIDILVENVPISLFRNYFSSFPQIILLVMYIVMLVYGIQAWSDKKEIGEPLGIWCSLMMCFYIYFNPLEAILYSSQLTFPIILFISWTFVRIPGKIKYYGLGIVTILLIMQNFGALYAPLK